MKHSKLDALGVSAFCESMAMMVQSSIQTDEAISLLLQGQKNGGILEEGLRIMQAKTEEGSALAAAMKAADIFPDYAIQMIEAGEVSGRVEDVLFRLAEYYAEQKIVSDKLKNAVIYPASMLVMIIIVLAVMLKMVLPAFNGVFQNLAGSLTASVYSYVHLAYGLCWVALVLMIVLVLCLVVGLLLWNSSKRSMLAGILQKIPVTGVILETLGLFRFTSALSIYLASGELQDIAVRKSMELTDCKPVKEKLKRCAYKMEEGHSIAQVAYDEALFEPVYGRMLLAGERSGSLESVLKRLTTLLQQHYSSLIDRLVGTVDPLLSGILMITIGVSLLSVMLPLIGMMNSIV